MCHLPVDVSQMDGLIHGTESLRRRRTRHGAEPLANARPTSSKGRSRLAWRQRYTHTERPLWTFTRTGCRPGRHGETGVTERDGALALAVRLLSNKSFKSRRFEHVKGLGSPAICTPSPSGANIDADSRISRARVVEMKVGIHSSASQ